MKTLAIAFALTLPQAAFSQNFSSDELLRFVEQSPETVGAHDLESWLNLFTPHAVVADPVGSPEFRNSPDHAAMKKFWDVFIAPNQITFQPERDFAQGMEVLRDLRIVTQMDDRCTIEVPLYIHYNLVNTEAGLKIDGLRAYWELSRNTKAIAEQGFNCIDASFKMGGRILSILGPIHAIQFAAAANNIGQGGKDRVAAMIEALNGDDETAFRKAFAKDASIACSEDGSVLNVADFWARAKASGLAWTMGGKGISAGHSSLVRFQFDDEKDPGVMMAHFVNKDQDIKELKCFFNALVPN